MKILIFAGGAGTRLWPLSRKQTPKQFEPFFEGKSTLQLAIERVEQFGLENIFISTNEAYFEIIKSQVPGLPEKNIFKEPAKRDLAAAIGLSLMKLKNQGIEDTIAMIWSDHLMQRPSEFTQALNKAEKLIQKDKNRFVFIGEKPRFANNTIGWIHTGEENKNKELEFKGWKYQPELNEAKEMLESQEWYWNPGYFIYDSNFALDLYKKHMPEMHKKLEEMVNSEEKIKQNYPQLEAVNFDNAIIEKIKNSQAIVIKTDMGWSDPGTLYAMKEAMTENEEENFKVGKVKSINTQDCLIYNEEPKKLVTTIGIKGHIIVNTKDAILVCNKNNAQEVKKLITELEDEGLEEYL